jgi:hypothetical protein
VVGLRPTKHCQLWGVRLCLARQGNPIPAEMNALRLGYLLSATTASGVFGFFPTKTLPNNSMVVLVQMPP